MGLVTRLIDRPSLLRGCGLQKVAWCIWEERNYAAGKIQTQYRRWIGGTIRLAFDCVIFFHLQPSAYDMYWIQ